MEFKTVKDVWNAVKAGKAVYWKNTAYKVFVEPNLMPERTKELAFRQFAELDGSILAVRCIENYFGSILYETELGNLFTKETV
jgi:hypothetical protein